jgi:hypothetical protein
VQVPIEQLPPYTAEAQEIFDDSLAPEVFGIKVERRSFLTEPHFETRARTADHVFRAKLLTIASDRVADQVRYKLVFQPVGEPLVGSKIGGEVELMVGRGSSSLNMLRSMAPDAVGRTSLLLVRRYRLNMDRVLHFRGEPDTPEAVLAVQEARKRRPPEDTEK